ncbi:hypothetical protein GF412_02130 [Candidatus Micrarchaeota archaeon]|nr:hypothetical protein [Candidatus Micrarchaeota archaeon]
MTKDQSEATRRAVNDATGSNYTPDQINADPELQARITAPTPEQAQEEAEKMETRLTEAGATAEIARAEADRYAELRLKESKTEEDYTRMLNIASSPERAQNLEGISSEQYSPAMELCQQWEEKAEKAKGKEQEHALQMADMFRALATTQVVEPEALEAVLKRKDISKEQKKQIKAMFLPNLEAANELAEQGKTKPDIHAALDAERMEARKAVFLQPKLVPLLKDAGLSENRVKEAQEMNKLHFMATDKYYEEGDTEALEAQNERARIYADDPNKFAQETYAAAKQSGYFSIGELNSMAATVAAIGTIAALDEEEDEASGAEAAAYAQLVRDLEDMAREDQERAEEAKELIEELMEKAEESGEQTKVADLDDEMKERLEKLGVEQDKTIKDAVEATNKIIENVSAQSGRIEELKRNSVVGLEPSFHENPAEVMEMNGVTNGGEITEFGQSVMPDILKASGASFNVALDQIMDAVPIDGREEFMERADEARATITQYMANPENAENQKAAAEILTNPEFVAVRAAFEEALADNAADTLKKLNS